jgi:hypothetical protein
VEIRIRSGGQTGVDRAALDFAIARGLGYGGWCPRGGWAEDRTTPPGLLKDYPKLTATPSAAPEQRTEWNVRDSDATLILVPSAMHVLTGGTRYTKACAEYLHARPFLVAPVEGVAAARHAARWIVALARQKRGAPLEINIAGPRESARPGVYDETKVFLASVWSELEQLPG